MERPATTGLAPPTLHLPDVRDRARAAFLGLALGDALGATVEFMTAGEIRAAHGVHRELTGGGWLRLRPGQVTDDTEMSLAMARAIDAHGGWSGPAVADAFAAWLKGRPADVGSTCRAGIRRWMLEGTLEGPPGEWDAGNGAAMRVLPVALLTLGDEAALRRLAVAQGRLTHHHPLSDAACLLVGRLVQAACLGRSMAWLRGCADAAVREEPRLRFTPYRGLASGYVADTMQTVLHHLFATRDFEACLVGVANQGGDADTTGAIAGAIAGLVRARGAAGPLAAAARPRPGGGARPAGRPAGGPGADHPTWARGPGLTAGAAPGMRRAHPPPRPPMDFLAQRWLPILLSAVAVFVLSAASHMFLPWRQAEFGHVPGFEALQAAVRALPPGQYVFPAGPDPKARGSKEALAAWAAGPSGFLTIVPRAPLDMGRNLGQSFLVYLAVSFLCAYLATFTLGAAPPTIAVVRLVSTVGILAYAVGTSFTSIWFARPWKAWGADLLDAVVQGFAMAGVFAWLWPR